VINALNKDQGATLKTPEDTQNFQDIKWKKAKPKDREIELNEHLSSF
jgi:hypothetical protein